MNLSPFARMTGAVSGIIKTDSELPTKARVHQSKTRKTILHGPKTSEDVNPTIRLESSTLSMLATSNCCFGFNRISHSIRRSTPAGLKLNPLGGSSDLFLDRRRDLLV